MLTKELVNFWATYSESSRNRGAMSQRNALRGFVNEGYSVYVMVDFKAVLFPLYITRIYSLLQALE